jgi:prepilin-type N-terminal cleavage/methylation domain-containing protein
MCAVPWHSKVLLRRAYTLIELLIVITVMGIAAAIVAPSMADTGVLRVQGAIRTIVSDIAIAQSDCIAYQKGRAIVFHNEDPANPRYVVCEVNGPTIDESVDRIRDQAMGGDQFGHSVFENINLSGGMIIFDELGGPVNAPQSSTPAPAQSFDIVGSGQRFRINIDAYTGRVTVESLPL